MFRSVDTHKDQTYMMARVHRSDFEAALFPLGHRTKPQVVAMAREWEIPEADGKESQDICFVLDGHAHYMRDRLGVQDGPIEDIDTGRMVGRHAGHFGFTVGQRRGLNVSANRPVYVLRVDAANNTVYVGDKHHLETTTFRVLSPHWIQPDVAPSLERPLRSMVKIRYASDPVLATITPCSDRSNAPDALLVTVEVACYGGHARPDLRVLTTKPSVPCGGGGYIEAVIPIAPFDPGCPAHVTQPLLRPRRLPQRCLNVVGRFSVHCHRKKRRHPKKPNLPAQHARLGRAVFLDDLRNPRMLVLAGGPFL